MKIERLRVENLEGRVRALATITWEDCNRPTQDIYFETETEFASFLTLNPDAFLVACALPAMYFGEKRIAIRESICPDLRSGLATALEISRCWHHPDQNVQVPVIEASVLTDVRSEPKDRRAGLFLSGGIDSLAVLRANQLEIPRSHPSSIKDCLFVYGFDIAGYEKDQRDEPEKNLRYYRRILANLNQIARDTGVTLIPVYTNIKYINDELSFWMEYFTSAALSAVAHSFSNRLRQVSISSCDAVPALIPWGSHPMLDPYYSSSNMAIRFAGLRYTRFEKTRLVAEWDTALHNVHVCTINEENNINCGNCEKCIRTMTALVALGKLEGCRAFPLQNDPKGLLEQVSIDEDIMSFYRELITPLKEQGRTDLSDVIEKKIGRLEEKSIKGIIKRIDRKYLGRTLDKVWNQIQSPSGESL